MGGHVIIIPASQRTETLVLNTDTLYSSNESDLLSQRTDSASSTIIKIATHSSYISTVNCMYLNYKKITSYKLRKDRVGIDKKIGPDAYDKLSFVPNIKRLLNEKGYI